MRNIFVDEILEKKFRKDGYVKVPFISPEEVAQLKQLFFDTLPQSGGQITSEETGVAEAHFITYDFTFIDKNPEYKRKVFELISKYFKPHMDRILAEYRPIIAIIFANNPQLVRCHFMRIGRLPMKRNVQLFRFGAP